MAEKIRLSNLLIYQQRIKKKADKQFVLFNLARKLYHRHRQTYVTLLEDYERLDYRIAELDGRLTYVDIRSHRTGERTVVDFKKVFQKMSDEKKKEFLKDLRK